MKKTTKEVPADNYEGQNLNDADFRAAPAEGSNIESGEVEEVFRTEVGEDGQLSSYNVVQLGGHLGPTGNSAKGKIFIQLRDGDDNKVDDRTEIRFIGRPKNGNQRKALTDWLIHRDLDRDDPRQRQPLSPVTDEEGDPQLVSDGRIIGVEVRNTATNYQVNLQNSTIQIPAQFGY